MQLEKTTVVDVIRERVGPDQANQAAQMLPDQIDPQQHAELLGRFGVSPQDLTSQVTSGQTQEKASWLSKLFHR
jgi:hypothetical protein